MVTRRKLFSLIAVAPVAVAATPAEKAVADLPNPASVENMALVLARGYRTPARDAPAGRPVMMMEPGEAVRVELGPMITGPQVRNLLDKINEQISGSGKVY